MYGILDKSKITLSDIEKIIELKLERSEKIEFKKTIDIDIFNERTLSKLVVLISAMANTSGGYIFYGIENKRKKASEISAISNNKITSELIKTAVQSKVSPPINNLQISKIEVSVNEFIIFIKLPKSSDAPHMSPDLKYYKRSGVKDVIMTEQEIRAAYTQAKQSDLDLFGLMDTKGIPVLKNGFVEQMNFFPKFLIKNYSNIVEKIFKVELYIPSALHDANFNLLQDKFSRLEDNYSVFSASKNNPIFQNEILSVLEAKIFVTSENFQTFEEENIIIKIYFSNGVKTHTLKLNQTFTYNKKPLNFEDFSSNVIGSTKTLFL